MARRKTGDIGREYMVVYHSILPALEVLSREERGDVFTWALKYSETGDEPDMNGQKDSVKIVYALLKRYIDDAETKYQATVKRNRDIALARAGKRGGIDI